jgi:hypothetical protein
VEAVTNDFDLLVGQGRVDRQSDTAAPDPLGLGKAGGVEIIAIAVPSGRDPFSQGRFFFRSCTHRFCWRALYTRNLLRSATRGYDPPKNRVIQKRENLCKTYTCYFTEDLSQTILTL